MKREESSSEAASLNFSRKRHFLLTGRWETIDWRWSLSHAQRKERERERERRESRNVKVAFVLCPKKSPKSRQGLPLLDVFSSSFSIDFFPLIFSRHLPPARPGKGSVDWRGRKSEIGSTNRKVWNFLKRQRRRKGVRGIGQHPSVAPRSFPSSKRFTREERRRGGPFPHWSFFFFFNAVLPSRPLSSSSGEEKRTAI